MSFKFSEQNQIYMANTLTQMLYDSIKSYKKDIPKLPFKEWHQQILMMHKVDKHCLVGMKIAILLLRKDYVMQKWVDDVISFRKYFDRIADRYEIIKCRRKKEKGIYLSRLKWKIDNWNDYY